MKKNCKNMLGYPSLAKWLFAGIFCLAVSQVALAQNVGKAVSQAISSQVSKEVVRATVNKFLPKVKCEVPPLAKSTFQARPAGVDFNFVSGTLFKAKDGKTYGVIAAHGLAQANYLSRVKQVFEADVFDVNTQQFVTVPAKVIQISAPSWLDLALVGFSLPEEVTLQPFTVFDKPIGWQAETLQSQGFSRQEMIHIDERWILSTTPYSIRTTISLPRDERIGYCGGALLNDADELVGIHTGSVLSARDEQEDRAYATQAIFLDKLVEAYYNKGKATIPFLLEEKYGLDLNVDEYVSEISLFDKNNQEITTLRYPKRLAYRHLMEWVEISRPRYADISVKKVNWIGTGKQLLEDNNDPDKKPYKKYRYDFNTHRAKEIAVQAPKNRITILPH